MQALFLVPESGDSIQVPGDQATVGRRDGCEVLLSDGSVSRAHARLERRADGWYVVDNGSANGTFVDGARVAEARLGHGGEVRFGALSFRVMLQDDEAPQETVQFAVPRKLQFDEPAPTVRRPPNPPAAPTVDVTGAAAGMTLEQAAGLLGLPPGSSPVDGRRRYEQMYNDYQVRVTNAPTAALRRMYQRNLNELKQAFEVLYPGQRVG